MRAATPERKPAVQRINLAWYSQLGMALEPLKTLGTAEKFEFTQFMALHTAMTTLETLADQQTSTLQLRVSRSHLRVLIDEIRSFIMDPNRDAVFESKKYSIGNSPGR
jgi:hypothetical protein